MSRIAQITDLHLIEDDLQRRGSASRTQLSLISAGRPLDAADRRRRALSAIRTALRFGAEHIVITGDLTEDGHDAQFGVLAEVLAQSSIAPERITLLPGNHDAYTDLAAFDRALAGPLRPYAKTSRAGEAVWLDDVAIVPVSTMIRQSFIRAAGAARESEWRNVARIARDLGRSEITLVVAQHHPPTPHASAVVTYWDRLQNHRFVGSVLAAHPAIHVIHGHIHREDDYDLGDGELRVFSAADAVANNVSVRFYEAYDRRLFPVAAVAPATSCSGEVPLTGTAPALA